MELNKQIVTILKSYYSITTHMDLSVNSPLVVDLVKAISEQTQKAVHYGALTGSKVVGYRLDNRIDFTQNKIVWEVINQYRAEIENGLQNNNLELREDKKDATEL